MDGDEPGIGTWESPAVVDPASDHGVDSDSNTGPDSAGLSEGAYPNPTSDSASGSGSALGSVSGQHDLGPVQRGNAEAATYDGQGNTAMGRPGS